MIPASHGPEQDYPFKLSIITAWLNSAAARSIFNVCVIALIKMNQNSIWSYSKLRIYEFFMSSISWGHPFEGALSDWLATDEENSMRSKEPMKVHKNYALWYSISHSKLIPTPRSIQISDICETIYSS